MRRNYLLACASVALLSCASFAEDKPQQPQPKPLNVPAAGTEDAPTQLEPVKVTASPLAPTPPPEPPPPEPKGRAADLGKTAMTASEGVVDAQEIEQRPISRVGEVLETVPGLIVTQHSGDGKANQYFFRGFNLDHGTDFATWLDDMPVNMRTHAHGQGYTDINFVIPELINDVVYMKGPVYASEGDFSSTGAAHMEYAKTLDHSTAQITAGSFNEERALFMAAPKLSASSNVLAALELDHYDGPWQVPEGEHKISAVLGYNHGTAADGWSVTGMAYFNEWTATDQIPQRAVTEGLVSRFGTLNPTDGGRTQRYSLNAEYHQQDECGSIKANAFVIAYEMNLWNDFTYFLNDPVNGDQFEQSDERVRYGFNLERTFKNEWCGHEMENTVGVQQLNDNIDVGLYKTKNRTTIGTTRADTVFESSFCPYIENKTQWLDKLKTVVGVRGDMFLFDVSSDNPVNSGEHFAGKASPKASIIMGPWDKTEYYLNFGYGIHSNDARGVETSVDPTSGDRVQKASGLVETRGGEFGIRSAFIPHLNTSLAAFLLDSNSELVFDGDAGTTAPNRPSRRYGMEFSNYYTPLRGLTFDLDFSMDHARFRDAQNPIGNHIPGAVKQVLSTGVSFERDHGWFGGSRFRFFGPRPLIEDGSQNSKATCSLSARVGYKFKSNWKVTLEGFNLLNRKDSDIDYYYASRLKGEPAAGVADDVFHPVEPIQGRLTLTYTW
jgi:hypothetical protein